MAKDKSALSTPRRNTAGTAQGSGSGRITKNNKSPASGSSNGLIHFWLKPDDLREILRCNDAELQVLRDAMYQIMQTQSKLDGKKLRALLLTKGEPVASLLSGQRWQHIEYPEERTFGKNLYPERRTFEKDVELLMKKIKGDTTKRLNREAKGEDQESFNYQHVDASTSLDVRALTHGNQNGQITINFQYGGVIDNRKLHEALRLAQEELDKRPEQEGTPYTSNTSTLSKNGLSNYVRREDDSAMFGDSVAGNDVFK